MQIKDKIDIKGIDKAELLAGLYNASRPLGMGFLQATSDTMTKEQAQRLLEKVEGEFDFDYLQGRVLKINLSKDELDFYLYDRDNGEGAAARVVNKIRQGQVILSEEVKPANLFEMFVKNFKNGNFGDKKFDQAMSEENLPDDFKVKVIGNITEQFHDNELDS